MDSESIKKALLEKKEIRIAHYRLIRFLAKGGMGNVYLAYEDTLDRYVALKFLSPELSADVKTRERFLREARIAARLNHPNIVSVYFAGLYNKQPFFAMEYIDGPSLERILQEKGRLRAETALKLMKQACAALKAAWQKKQIHRDIKPANMMLTRNGVLKITDFGLAKVCRKDGGPQLTSANIVLGTPHFMSPEQAQASKEIDFRTDIYSLGATFYYVVGGHLPYTGDSAVTVILKHIKDPLPPLSRWAPDIHPSVEALICRMMAKDPADRYESYDALMKAIDETLELVRRQPASRAAMTTAPTMAAIDASKLVRESERTIHSVDTTKLRSNVGAKKGSGGTNDAPKGRRGKPNEGTPASAGEAEGRKSWWRSRWKAVAAVLLVFFVLNRIAKVRRMKTQGGHGAAARIEQLSGDEEKALKNKLLDLALLFRKLKEHKGIFLAKLFDFDGTLEDLKRTRPRMYKAYRSMWRLIYEWRETWDRLGTDRVRGMKEAGELGSTDEKVMELHDRLIDKFGPPPQREEVTDAIIPKPHRRLHRRFPSGRRRRPFPPRPRRHRFLGGGPPPPPPEAMEDLEDPDLQINVDFRMEGEGIFGPDDGANPADGGPGSEEEDF